MEAASFEGAVKAYGSLVALAGLTLEVRAGEVFALVGPNGAGKTTALGLLTGILRPTAGTVRVFGHDLSRDPLAAKARLGYVPDRPYLWPRWTPRETLRFVGATFGLSGPGLDRSVEAELRAFGLEGVASRPNESLSHGTRQKVALAQAFLHDPGLFVLDEPMVGLDPSAQRLLVSRLAERTARGAAVLLTTHQLSLAEEVAERVGVLVGGRLLAVGDPRSLAAGARPAGRLAEVFFDLAPGPTAGEGP
ncbi:MAG: ABC transporter ATP-binding protein [Acidobacteria bacterium]|nr:MAG: ABC transporter ATP-binding protein [Acidobacteriota bacterium]